MIATITLLIVLGTFNVALSNISETEKLKNYINFCNNQSATRVLNKTSADTCSSAQEKLLNIISKSNNCKGNRKCAYTHYKKYMNEKN